ncbi:substrate-binding domain-containing protein [Enterococcus lactis]
MKNKFRKILGSIAILTASILLSACGNSGSADDSTGYVGIAMPTKSAERWIADGNNMVSELEKLGYKTDLQYGEDKVENQVAQIENMITKGVDTLVIASIDGSALTDVLAKAKEADIKVIAYDRLLMNSENVDYYATFDNFGVGVSQAAYIEEHLGLKEGKGPFTIELFGGSPDDNNALINYNGVMSVLQPYMDNGQLIVPSGQTSFSQIATLRWDGSTAQARMDNLLSANYTDQTLDAVLSPYDPISLGIISSLKVGVSQAAYIEEHLGLKEGKGPFTIELFGGSPDDNNALINYNGVMSVLQPYMDNGQLIVPSGQTSFSQIATLRWDGSTAQARMDNLLSANYTDQTLDAVLSPYDPISLGIISSLKGVGYGSESKPLPVITGQDATVAGVKSIIAGEQTQTIFKDTRILAKNTIEMIKAISDGEEVPVNDTETYDNGVKTVPTYLANTVSVDKDNYQAELIDTDYYKESDLKN